MESSARPGTLDIPLALRIDDRELSEIVPRAADVLSIVDKQGRILEVNRQGHMILGYSPGEMAQLSVFDLDGELDAEQFQEIVLRTQDGACVTVEHRFRCKDGSPISVEVRIGRVQIEGYETTLLFAARDIGERKRAEQRLWEALTKAEEFSRMKSAFLANFGHEIRTPLNAIVGYTSLVADLVSEKGNEAGPSALTGIQRATERLLNTIQSTIDLSKMENGSLSVRPKRLDLVACVEGEVELFRRDAQRKGLSLSWEMGDDRPRIRFDRYCLSRAIRKLIDNAIKFTEKGGVALQLERDASGTVVLEVRDSGVGISPAYMPHLFEPFSQEDAGMCRRFEGVGNGLALAKRFVELNGASVSVESRKEKGTVSRIHFPRQIQVCDDASSSAFSLSKRLPASTRVRGSRR